MILLRIKGTWPGNCDRDVHIPTLAVGLDGDAVVACLLFVVYVLCTLLLVSLAMALPSACRRPFSCMRI